MAKQSERINRHRRILIGLIAFVNEKSVEQVEKEYQGISDSVLVPNRVFEGIETALTQFKESEVTDQDLFDHTPERRLRPVDFAVIKEDLRLGHSHEVVAHEFRLPLQQVKDVDDTRYFKDYQKAQDVSLIESILEDEAA